jgi:ATP-dependent helicase/nuclease subunit A
MASVLSQLQLTPAQTDAATGTDPALVVTAGAGSGKTRALAARFVYLLEIGHPLRSLVAITFTDKAAREMRNRIRRLVADWLLVCPAADRGRWQEILVGLDAARIGTIHSFCARLLRAHPAEAHVDPTFAVLDENTAAMLKARALESALAWAANDPQTSALFGPLTEFRLRKTVQTLLDRRLEAQAAFEILSDDPLAVWQGALQGWLDPVLAASLWREFLAALAELQALRESDRLEQARRRILGTWDEAQAARQAGEWETVLSKLGLLRQAIVTGGAKAHWDPEALAEAREAMASLRTYFDERLAPLADRKKPQRWALDRQSAALMPLLQATFARALGEYAQAKEERNALDFDDLEALATDLLVGNSAVRARWQQEIDAVLVDEFQDTNARQRQIVYALSRFPTPVRTASPNKSLFVVGDGKQSIYRFRGADVTVFREVQADVTAGGGQQVDLDLTFRAHAPLVEALNALLAPILGKADDPARPFQVPFAPLRAFRQTPHSNVQPPYVEFHLGLGKNAEEGRQAAAGALARRLRELHSHEGVAWGEMALLFRASTGFPPYEEALEQGGIPFVTIAGRGFYERPEIRDLLNALATLADPSDDLALAGFLRSPLVGLSDAALYRLRFGADGHRRSLWSALQDAPDEFVAGSGPGPDLLDAERAAYAWRLLTDLASLADRAPVGQLLNRLLDMTHYRAALALAGGERLLRNVDKLLDDAHSSGLLGVSEFLEYVQTLRDVGAREAEAATEAQASAQTEGAVQLMTVHKAKGLEFPVVVIADAARSTRAMPPAVSVEPDWGVLLDLRDGDARPALYQLAILRQTEMDEAESRRLLYVAATRVQEKLIVSGHTRLSTAKKDPGRLLLSGWLDWLGQIVGLNAIRLDSLPSASQELELDGKDELLVCVCHPPGSPPAAPAREVEREKETPVDEVELLPMLISAPAAGASDDKTLDRESDPPSRVWRVVPRAQDPAGPAWVVGTLVHAALRRWRFPSQPGFEVLLYPHALDAGLTDRLEISNAIQTTRRLLTRFCHHPLWAEMDAAERHHELPYVLDEERGILDLLYRVKDLWTIAEFKTDRLADLAAARQKIQNEGYDVQVTRYVRAVEHLLGERPRALIVCLNVARGVQIVEC